MLFSEKKRRRETYEMYHSCENKHLFVLQVALLRLKPSAIDGKCLAYGR